MLLGKVGEVRHCKDHLWAFSPVGVRFSSKGHETFSEEGLPLTLVPAREGLWCPDVEFILVGES